jgi:DNA repair protein RecN (Recombination protein N)
MCKSFLLLFFKKEGLPLCFAYAAIRHPVLTALSIRDVVLIERLDLTFGPGLTVLTGETGAGKSILLDSLGLALGARSDAGLLRAGATQATVSARFQPPPTHQVHALLEELGLPAEDDLTLRRAVERNGRSRAWVNDAPVGASALKQIGQMLVEVQGQHDQMGLADPAGHLRLLDAFGTPPDLRADLTIRYRAWRAATERLEAARAAIAAARREEDFLRHATAELDALAAQPGEETQLAETRARLQQGEKRAEAIESAIAELTPRDRRSHGPASALRAAARVLQRLVPAHSDAENPAASAMAALERAEEALSEAETLLSRLAAEAEADPRALEQAEERLFALRAAARKHGVPVSELPTLLTDLTKRLAALDVSEAEITALTRETTITRAAYIQAAERVSAARQAAATALEQAVTAELPPLRLDRARFFAEVSRLPEAEWGATGADSVRFLIATNPGQPAGPLGRVASGGELSRLMLALKVVFSTNSTVPTLVFDEVDSGVGGATAAAVGDRLARVAEGVQVLVVTHSPQVAARGAAHLRVSKATENGRTETSVTPLKPTDRREEIARMLAGETVTTAARAAAKVLLQAT